MPGARHRSDHKVVLQTWPDYMRKTGGSPELLYQIVSDWLVGVRWDTQNQYKNQPLWTFDGASVESENMTLNYHEITFIPFPNSVLRKRSESNEPSTRCSHITFTTSTFVSKEPRINLADHQQSQIPLLAGQILERRMQRCQILKRNFC